MDRHPWWWPAWAHAGDCRAQLGLKTHIYAPDADTSPAGEVATRTTTASYDDTTALRDFAAGMDAVTSEFEMCRPRQWR